MHHQNVLINNHKMHHPKCTLNKHILFNVVAVASTKPTYTYIYFIAFPPASLHPLSLFHSTYCPSPSHISSNTRAHPRSSTRTLHTRTHSRRACTIHYARTQHRANSTTLLRTSAIPPNFASVCLSPLLHTTGNARAACSRGS